jgi:hypothetical protein
MADSIWHLHDLNTQKSLNALPFEQMVSVLRSATEEELSHWLAWTAGWTQWKKVKDVPEIMSALTEEVPAPIPVDFTPKEEPKDRRKHPRYEVRFRVVIVVGSHTFRTHTKNISLDGLLLEDPIPPDMFKAVSQVFIGSPELKENISFTGVQVGETRNPTRFHLQEKKEAQTKLNTWIQSLVQKHGLKAS